MVHAIPQMNKQSEVGWNNQNFPRLGNAMWSPPPPHPPLQWSVSCTCCSGHLLLPTPPPHPPCSGQCPAPVVVVTSPSPPPLQWSVSCTCCSGHLPLPPCSGQCPAPCSGHLPLPTLPCSGQCPAPVVAVTSSSPPPLAVVTCTITWNTLTPSPSPYCCHFHNMAKHLDDYFRQVTLLW